MGIRKQLEKILLKEACGLLQEAGLNAKLIESDIMDQALAHKLNIERANQSILEIELFNVGDRGDYQLVQISFLPATEEIIKVTGFNTVQFFCCINEDLPISTCNELARAILKINPKIVAGAFNLDEKDASFFYKSSAIITDNMDQDVALALLQVHIGIFLSNIDIYNDVIMDIIEGLRTADEAILKGII